MRVTFDEARRHETTGGIDNALTRSDQAGPDFGNDAALDAHIGGKTRRPGAIDDCTVPDENIGHAKLPALMPPLSMSDLDDNKSMPARDRRLWPTGQKVHLMS
jgi:hypothetical protein